jgi:hypothetical protein
MLKIYLLFAKTNDFAHHGDTLQRKWKTVERKNTGEAGEDGRALLPRPMNDSSSAIGNGAGIRVRALCFDRRLIPKICQVHSGRILFGSRKISLKR